MSKINSTQKYLDNERQSNFLTSLLPSETIQSPPATILPIKEEIDIDVDIEKQIAQLQEGRLNGTIKPIENISIDPDKQLKEWNLEKGLENFLANVKIEKEDLGKKIAEEEKKKCFRGTIFSINKNKKT